MISFVVDICMQYTPKTKFIQIRIKHLKMNMITVFLNANYADWDQSEEHNKRDRTLHHTNI